MAKIALDAGHGLYTPGKQTPDGEKEWSFNNVIVKSAIRHLNEYQDVEIVRLDDPTGKRDVPLKERTDKANREKCAILISVHHNAFLGKWGGHTGTETYTYDGHWRNAERLARLVHHRMLDCYCLYDRGLKKANFHMLRESNMPAILTEGGYMDSKIDIKKLRDSKVLNEVGEGIAEGVAAYFNLKKKRKAPRYDVSPSKRLGEVFIGNQAMNYRTRPDLDARIIKVLPAGYGKDEPLHLYEVEGHWLRLGHGWISNKDNAYATVKMYPPDDTYRVIIDGKQVGAYAEDANITEQVQKAIKSGKSNVKIEKVITP